MLLQLTFISLLIHQTSCQCTFPSEIIGSWVSSNDGTWIINSTSIQSYNTISITTGIPIRNGINTLDFTCFENRGDSKYVIKSELFELFNTAFVNLYQCLDIRVLSSNKIIYYQATLPDPGGFQFTAQSLYEDVCNLVTHDLPYLHHVALRSGSETTALINCPSIMFGSYNYEPCADVASNDTSVDVCPTRQQLVYNYTLCNTHLMFSQEGVLDCVYHETSGSITYLTLYNRDSISTDDVSYYRFICLAIQGEPGSLQLTAYPQRCLDNQDPTTIDSPGQSFNYTSYHLCPIIIEEDTPFDWLPIIIAIVCVLLVLIIIAIIICCCCCCKRRKKQEDEEQAIDKSDTSSQHSSRKNSIHQDDGENTSLDSGISEPLPSGRTERDERILEGEGEADDFGDKDSRPRSGERSRMSDLPPSTVPPDDEDNNSEQDAERKEENVEPIDEQQKEEDGEQKDEEDGGEKKEEETTEENEDEDKEKMDEENDDDNKTEDNDEKDKSDVEDQPEPEQEKEAENEHVEEDDNDGPSDSEHDEGNVNVVADGDGGQEDEQQRKEREGDDMDVSDEEERRKIGLKKGKHFTPTGALTTTLVSRDEDERKRQKQKSKTKKQKMNRLAKDKTDKDKKRKGKGGRHGRDKHGRRHGRDGKGDGDGSDDEFDTSDDEARLRGGRTAPFMQQYKQKKHIEQVLDEQHYWSDPEKDKHGFKDFDNISSKFGSESSGSEEEEVGPDGKIRRRKKRRHTDSEGASTDSEIEIIGPDGNVIRVKKPIKQDRKGRRKSEDGDNISNADSEYMRQKMLKRAGSLDSMMSVDDRKKLNEHKMVTDNDVDGESSPDDVLVDEDGNIINTDGTNKVDNEDNNVNNSKTKGKGKTRTIHVKEKSNEPGADVNVKRMKKGDRIGGNTDCNDEYDDIDKYSDGDSGMDDDEVGDVDAILTKDQQAMVVSMLFDEDMNIRPEFYRDENGCIVRRLDNTIIYDPKTGRFTFRKRLGQIFKVPRLKRNDKGRPTGGYIEDEFGPKTNGDKGRKSSSARKSRSGKSRSGRDIRSSSAEVKRSRTDMKNVDFNVPEDNKDSIHGDEEDGFYKRGGNRSRSAMHRLKRRLFSKRSRGEKGVLPDVRVKRAWPGDDYGHGGRNGTLGPLHMKHGQKSPWMQRKGALLFGGDPDMIQMYREGLQSDRKFLETLQGKLNSQNHPGGNRKLGGNSGTEDGNHPDLVNGLSQDDTLGHDGTHIPGSGNEHSQFYGHSHTHGHSHGHGINAEYSFFDEDGRFIIRETGCPDLKNPKVPLFTIIRRPEDMESDEQLNEQTAESRNVKSAPLAVQDFNNDPNSDRSDRQQKYVSENSLARSDGRYSQYSYIDDNRLRRLLEELYKDKKYLDRYVETTEPKSEAVIHSKGLAEHGRDYLLERADYWEKRGPLPPRPPMTEVGWKMQRQATLAASRQASELTLSTNETCTPDLSARHIPGVPESHQEDEDDDGCDGKENVSKTDRVNESEA